MGGIVGRLFREFAVNRTVAVHHVGLVALTLTPLIARASLLLKRQGSQFPATLAADLYYAYLLSPSFYCAVVRFFRLATSPCNLYLLPHRSLPSFYFPPSIFVTGWLYVIIPKGFFPSRSGFISAGPRRA